MFRKLSPERRAALLDRIEELNAALHQRLQLLARLERPLRAIIEHYYPGGRAAPRTPKAETLAQQGVSVGYDSGSG